jgi:hypothetical protein
VREGEEGRENRGTNGGRRKESLQEGMRNFEARSIQRGLLDSEIFEVRRYEKRKNCAAALRDRN